MDPSAPPDLARDATVGPDGPRQVDDQYEERHEDAAEREQCGRSEEIDQPRRGHQRNHRDHRIAPPAPTFARAVPGRRRTRRKVQVLDSAAECVAYWSSTWRGRSGPTVASRARSGGTLGSIATSSLPSGTRPERRTVCGRRSSRVPG